MSHLIYIKLKKLIKTFRFIYRGVKSVKGTVDICTNKFLVRAVNFKLSLHYFIMIMMVFYCRRFNIDKTGKKTK